MNDDATILDRVRDVLNGVGPADEIISQLDAAGYAIVPKETMLRWRSFKDDPPPRGGVIIYMQPRPDGKLGVGVAYLAVDGSWRDIAPSNWERVLAPTKWMPMPEPDA